MAQTDDMSNRLNHPCNEMLLAAVRKKNIEDVQRLLKNPNLNVNYDVGDGNTILFESLYTENEAIFLSLLNAGFDINSKNGLQQTPLHIAVINSPISFMRELITRGADINAEDEECKHTPLSNAAFHGKLDAMCLLLYYGADCHVVGRFNMTPFMWALANDEVQLSRVLFNYYDNYSPKSDDVVTPLYLAVRKKNPLAIDILMSDTNQNECGETLLLLTLKQESESVELFKLIWFKYKEQICVDTLLLLDYLSHCCFSNSDWLECLHLLFTSPIAIRSLLECNYNNPYGLHQYSILSQLLFCLYRRKIDLLNRMSLIYEFVSFGVKIEIADVNLAYLLYGFNEELEAFIYTFNYARTNIAPNEFLPLTRFIYILEDDYKIEMVPPVFRYLYDTDHDLEALDIAQNVIVKSLGFSSLPCYEKDTIKMLCEEYVVDHQHITKRLDGIPVLPSLLELSRNQARQHIKQRCSINYNASQFHAIVRELNLPPYIKDIICFKTPIY